MSSWQISGSGVYIGEAPWRMYWVEWKTLKANPLRKYLELNKPATGRIVTPVYHESEDEREILYLAVYIVRHIVELRDIVLSVSAIGN